MPIRITPDFHQRLWKPEDPGQMLYTKRTQMSAQATIPSQTLNYHGWRNQSITGQNQIHTLSLHESSPSKNNNRKKILANQVLEKSRNKPKKKESHKNRMPTLTT